MFCPKCGKQLRDGASFCTGCGAPAAVQPTPAPQPERQTPVQPTPAAQTVPPQPAEQTLLAPAGAGEFAGDPMGEPGGEAAAVLYLQRLKQLFLQPKTLIPLALLLLSWFGLSFAQGTQSVPLKLLSWLSFAPGGLDRGAFGVFGGLLGKTAVGLSWTALCSGSLRTLGTGGKGFAQALRGAFSQQNAGEGIAGLVTGLLLGAGLYIVFAGIQTATWETTMAGLAGTVLSLLGLGRRKSSGGDFLSALLAGGAVGFPLCATILAIV